MSNHTVRPAPTFFRDVARLAAVIVITLQAAPSSAGVVFHVGPGPVQPDENLLFNDPGLISTGTTVEGITNQSGVIVQIMSNDVPIEDLTTPSAGQARIEAVDGAFNSVMITPQAGFFITEMEFNINVLGGQSGTFQLELLDQFNNVIIDDFDPNTLGVGQNFFSFETDGGTLIQQATLTAIAGSQIIQDIRQIRLGVVVPEPGSCLLLLTALPFFGLCRLRRR